jgi:ribose/xylose/arabinose/galactoside ABC-type transport system permease subunit
MSGPLHSALRRVTPQLVILAAVLFLNFLVFPDFFRIEFQNGRLFGNLIDVLNRGAPTALLCIGMTLVIATRGIDLSVGAVMAIAGAVAASLVVDGHGWQTALIGALAVGSLCGLWNGILVAVLRIQPIVATLVLMVAGRGIAQLVTEGTILTFVNPGLIHLGAGTIAGIPTPILIWTGLGLLVAAVVRKTALGMLIEAIGINESSSRAGRHQQPGADRRGLHDLRPLRGARRHHRGRGHQAARTPTMPGSGLSSTPFWPW